MWCWPAWWPFLSPDARHFRSVRAGRAVRALFLWRAMTSSRTRTTGALGLIGRWGAGCINKGSEGCMPPNYRAALDAAMTFLFHTVAHWHGASERGRYAMRASWHVRAPETAK